MNSDTPRTENALKDTMPADAKWPRTKPLKPIRGDERLSPEHYLAVRSDGLTFAICLREAAGEIELVREFDRLYGTALSSRPPTINSMIDEATGKTDADMQAFLRFVWNYIFMSVPEVRESAPERPIP